MKTPADIETASLADCIAGFRSKDLSARDLAEWAIANHEARGEAFHAYKTWKVDHFRVQADAADAAFAAGVDLGPLQGIPVSIKDLVGVSDYPIFAGCPRELPESWQVDGPVVRAIRQQLGVISGKTHTVQFAFSARFSSGKGFSRGSLVWPLQAFAPFDIRLLKEDLAKNGPSRAVIWRAL
ncbi:MAG: amidase family protein [Gammaproteobacteria bacterium]